jgi:hypothetical protein
MFIELTVVNPPVICAAVMVGTFQLYRVFKGTWPLIKFIGVILNDTPLQVIIPVGLILALANIVMVTVKGCPAPAPDLKGVTE